MNKSKKLKIAHKITKATVKTGDSYSATFAQSLKIVHAHDDYSVFLNTKIGSEFAFAVVECSEDAATGSKHSLSKNLGDGFYIIKFKLGNRHIVDTALRADVAKKIEQVTAAVSNNYSSRSIVTLGYAQLMGLSHGKSWYCSERDVELKGACPSFEGQLICYAYTA